MIDYILAEHQKFLFLRIFLDWRFAWETLLVMGSNSSQPLEIATCLEY